MPSDVRPPEILSVSSDVTLHASAHLGSYSSFAIDRKRLTTSFMTFWLKIPS